MEPVRRTVNQKEVPMDTLVIATHNLGKTAEFKEMLKNLPVTVKCLADYPQLVEPNETGHTFAANAKTARPACGAPAMPAKRRRTRRTTTSSSSR